MRVLRFLIAVACGPGATVATLPVWVAGTIVLYPAAARGQAVQGPRAALDAYRAGTRAYDLGRYEEAVAKFEEAYRLGGDARSLFNIGQAHFKAGRHQQAKTAYESYLRELPAASNRALVEGRLVEIERMVKEAESKTAPVAEPAAPPDTGDVKPPAGKVDAEVAGSAPALSPPESRAAAPGTAAPALSPLPSAPSLASTALPPSDPVVPIYKKWWFWTAIGGVVAVAATVSIVALRESPGPHGSLGEIGPGR